MGCVPNLLTFLHQIVAVKVGLNRRKLLHGSHFASQLAIPEHKTRRVGQKSTTKLICLVLECQLNGVPDQDS